MTPPCANCHRPETYQEKPGLFGKTALVQDGDRCPAYLSWPFSTRSSHSHLAQLDWWRRTNFEKARQDYYTFQNKLVPPPFRLDLGKASLHGVVGIPMRSISLKSTLWGLLDLASLDIGPRARFEVKVPIQDNAIPLDLLSLLKFTGLEIDGLGPFNVAPREFTIGDFGGIHIIMGISKAYNFFFNTPGVPRPAPGKDYPTQQDLDEAGVDWLPVANTYPNQYPGIGDFERTEEFYSKFPELFESDHRLPHFYNLEVLTSRILHWIRIGPMVPSKKSDDKSLLNLIREYLKSGSYLTFKVEDLKDFFLPGVMDLGPSSGEIKVILEKDNPIPTDASDFVSEFLRESELAASNIRLFVGMRDLNLQFDPMDYPAMAGSERPPIHLQSATLRAGAERTSRLGKTYAPGIEFRYYLESQELTAQGNLEIEAQLELPILGVIHVQGKVLFELAIKWTPDGLKIIPEKSLLQLDDWNILKGDEKSPFLTGLNFLLTDLPEARDPILDRLKGGNPFLSDTDTFILEGSAQTYQQRNLEFSGQFEFPRVAFGYFDEARILPNLHIPLDLLWKDQGSSIHRGKFVLNTQDMGGGKGSAGDLAYRLFFSLNPERSAPPNGLPVVDGGYLRLIPPSASPNLGDWDLELNSEWISVPGWEVRDLATRSRVNWTPIGSVPRVKLDWKANAIQTPVQTLDHPEFHLSWEPRISSYGHKSFVIPEFEFRANPNGVSAGKIRGKLQLVQENQIDKILEVDWDPRKRNLDFQNLNLKVSLQGLDILTSRFRKSLDPKVRWVGLDGRLQGGFNLNLQEDLRKWRGRGRLSFVGDSSGDVYWLNSRGNRVGPAILRNTRWTIDRFYGAYAYKDQILGRFRLNTLMNPGAFLDSSHWRDPVTPAYGGSGQRLKPYEVQLRQSLNHLPWSLRGFRRSNLDFLSGLCRKDPTCWKAGPLGR